MLTLKFVFNFSNAEVATILGKTEGAVKSLQHRALASLQKHVAHARTQNPTVRAHGARGRHRRPARLGQDDALQRADAARARPTTGRSTSAWRRSPTSGSTRSPTSIGGAKRTPAAIRVVDVPGTGAAAPRQPAPGGRAAPVLDGFSPNADPEDDLETLELELLVADRDHVERRLERVRKQAKSGDPALRAEVEQLEELLAHVDAGGSLADCRRAAARARAADDEAADPDRQRRRRGSTCKLEAELAELPEEEAAAFRDGAVGARRGRRRLFETLDLITFFTAGDKETRAWTLRRGETALDAAATIHRTSPAASSAAR